MGKLKTKLKATYCFCSCIGNKFKKYTKCVEPKTKKKEVS